MLTAGGVNQLADDVAELRRLLEVEQVRRREECSTNMRDHESRLRTLETIRDQQSGEGRTWGSVRSGLWAVLLLTAVEVWRWATGKRP